MKTDTILMLENNILSMIKESANLNYCCSEIVSLIQKNIDIESIAIRLRNKKGFDFSTFTGYSAEFIKNENGFCNCFMSGNFIYDNKGNPVPECVSTDFPITNSYKCNFLTTNSGSYWSNNLCQRVFIDNPVTNKIINTCKYRIEGYNSIALIPIRAGNTVIGLLQLNDKRENILSDELIQNMEHLCSIIGKVIITKKNDDKFFKKINEPLWI